MQNVFLRSRSGQAAMEFLMTYGWALLLVLVAVGAFTYLATGYSGFAGDSCTFPPGFMCSSFRVAQSSNDVLLILQNGLGASLSNVAFAVSDSETMCDGQIYSHGAGWADGEAITVTIVCSGASGSPLVTGSRFQGLIHLNYTSGGLLHTKQGQLSATIE